MSKDYLNKSIEDTETAKKLMHDIGNKLTVISCRAEWINLKKNDPNEVVQSSKMIMKQIDEIFALLNKHGN